MLHQHRVTQSYRSLFDYKSNLCMYIPYEISCLHLYTDLSSSYGFEIKWVKKNFQLKSFNKSHVWGGLTELL
jgi:hypothetical protein